MPVEHEALRALGLTEYGARVYATLLAAGPSHAETVAKAAPVPRTKVYAVLADLARRGWVEVEAGRPRRYAARRPRECVDRERARLDALLAAALPSLEAQFTDRSTRFAGNLWFLQGPEALAERSREMVERARRDVALVASFPLPGDDAALPRAIRAALRRGVRVRLLVPDPTLPAVRALVATGAEVRVNTVPPRFLLADGQQGLVSFPLPTETGHVDVKGIYNASLELVQVMGGVLGTLWDRAEPVAPRP